MRVGVMGPGPLLRAGLAVLQAGVTALSSLSSVSCLTSEVFWWKAFGFCSRFAAMAKDLGFMCQTFKLSLNL